MTRRHVITCDACGNQANWTRLCLTPEVTLWSTLATRRGIVDLCPSCTALARPIPVRHVPPGATR